MKRVIAQTSPVRTLKTRPVRMRRPQRKARRSRVVRGVGWCLCEIGSPKLGCTKESSTSAIAKSFSGNREGLKARMSVIAALLRLTGRSVNTIVERMERLIRSFRHMDTAGSIEENCEVRYSTRTLSGVRAPPIIMV